jgi:hypothetical protein
VGEHPFDGVVLVVQTHNFGDELVDAVVAAEPDVERLIGLSLRARLLGVGAHRLQPTDLLGDGRSVVGTDRGHREHRHHENCQDPLDLRSSVHDFPLDSIGVE